MEILHSRTPLHLSSNVQVPHYVRSYNSMCYRKQVAHFLIFLLNLVAEMLRSDSRHHFNRKNKVQLCVSKHSHPIHLKPLLLMVGQQLQLLIGGNFVCHRLCTFFLLVFYIPVLCFVWKFLRQVINFLERYPRNKPRQLIFLVYKFLILTLISNKVNGGYYNSRREVLHWLI